MKLQLTLYFISGFSQATLQREDTQEIIKNSMASKIEHDLRQRYKMFVDRYEAETRALQGQEQELLAGKEQIDEVLTRIEDEKVRFYDHEINLIKLHF